MSCNGRSAPIKSPNRTLGAPVVYVADVIGGFDVHPDSAHFVVEVAERDSAVEENRSARGQVMVVRNWFEEVQRRLGNP
jgi:hypothetical protein